MNTANVKETASALKVVAGMSLLVLSARELAMTITVHALYVMERGVHMEYSGNGPQFEYCWIRAKKNSGTVQSAIELIGEERVKDLAAIWWRYGIAHESGRLLLNPDGSDYSE
jgi:hypothetical protein